MNRRLLIRPGAIGDCILCFPVLEYLVSDYTEVWISNPVVPLVQFANSAHSISSTGLELLGVGDVPVPLRLWKRLNGFDSVISWYGANRIEFRDAISAQGVQCEFNQALPPRDYKGHATDFFAAQVGAPAGLSARIQTSRSFKQGSVVIHPFSGSHHKNWPLVRFQHLAEKLPLTVRWTCGPEETLADAIRFENLVDLANWLAGADLFIGNDSGIAHLAAAVGIPTLVLFGPTDPETWAPRASNVKVLRSNPLAALSVETVLDSANQLLGLF